VHEDPQLAQLEVDDLLAMLDDIEGIDRHGGKSSDIIIIIQVLKHNGGGRNDLECMPFFSKFTLYI
jgi:hypothetical protein